MTEKIRIETIRINGIQIPSDDTLLTIFNELETHLKRVRFINNSNQIIVQMRKFFNPHILDIRRAIHMELLLMKNYCSQCNLLGFDFHDVLYTKAVIMWFRLILGYCEMSNHAYTIKNTTKHANSFKKTGVYIDVGVNLNISEFNRFRQFKTAYKTWNRWRVDACLMSKNNQQMKNLLIQCCEIHKEMIKGNRA